jgi:hypothetical protein
MEGMFKKKKNKIKQPSSLYITTINVICRFFKRLGWIQIDHVYAVFGNDMVFQNNYKNKRNIYSLLLAYTMSPIGHFVLLE